MSELEQLTHIIDTILGTDNAERKKMEELLKGLRDRDFSAYIIAFTTLLKETTRTPVKSFCVVHIRRFTSDFVDNADSKWHTLTADAQKYLKDTLLDKLQHDEDSGPRRVLCDFIGDLASTIQCMDEERKKNCSGEGTQWNELMQILWKLLTSHNAFFMESSLRIMSILFVHCGREYAQYKDELLPVFKETLVHDIPVVNLSTMEAISCYLENVEFKNCKIFLELVPIMIERTLVICDKDQDLGIDAIAVFSDILDTEPRMLKAHYKSLVEVFKQIMKADADLSLKQCTLETLILAVERLCKEFNNDLDTIKEIAEIVFTFMITSDEEPDEEWLSPPEGYVENPENEDNPDSSIWFGMGLVDRIIRALNSKKVLPLFSNLILEMVKVDNWRYQHSALMSLAQVGEFIEDMSEFDPIVGFLFNFFEHPHPKVRYAALHAIGQSAEDCRPFFQQRFGRSVLEKLIPMMKDQTPRVISHALNALTNYLEECPKQPVLELCEEILTPALFILHNGSSYLKECACTAISNLAEVLGKDFIPFWPRTAESLFQVLENSDKSLKTLRADLIEALTSVGQAVEKEEFRKVAHKVIEKMLQIQNSEVQKMDPQTAYLLTSWHRVASTLTDEFTQYLHQVMPSIFELVNNVVKSQDEKNAEALEDVQDHDIVRDAINRQEGKNSEKLEMNHINTSESEDLVLAIKMIRGFSQELQAGYFNYVEQSAEIVVHLLCNSENEDVRNEAALCLPDLLAVIKQSNHPSKGNIVRNLHNLFIKNLWEAIWSELDAEMMKKMVDVMKDLIETGDRCMTEGELEEFSGYIFKTLELSEQKKAENNELYAENNDEYDDEDEEMLEETNKLEDELFLALAELIGILFKVYKEQTVPLAKLIYSNILPKALEPNAQMNLNKFGLFLIDDMIEHLGIELIPQEWPDLCQALLKFSTHDHLHLRHAAIYGIGCLGEKSTDVFKEMSSQCMEVLYKGLDIAPKKGEDTDEYGSMRDNIVASLGKIIKFQHSNINLPEAIGVWVKNLPLRHDIEEGKKQHELLVDIILESNAALVFGESGENLPKTIRVIAEVIDLKATSAEFKPKVGKVVQLLTATEETKALLQRAIADLDPKLQKKLQQVVEGGN